VVVAIPQGQALLQHSLDLEREAGGSRRGGLDHVFAAAQQMSEAALMAGSEKLGVRLPAPKMAAACGMPRLGKMSQKFTSSLTATQSERNCAATFQPISSMPFTILRRAASCRACQVASPRRATRSTARQMVLRLT